ncbi:NAD(P)/FAD-dependent oxidoreductase [Variovorax paradoxus]|uniref:NAD(P)/FAD-dependent oxidoreductase n=1 Tax=Variovorax paradoxus TaxID=34073 RepID=UPI00278539E9|nr:NAD(P)/FAD-dependent oxidoreductase [Variovorax paradoxus]MDQ0591471.1 L-2-hydroxyglutarate oxidase LhgO [Variovorax paradoxus]
MDEFDCAVIGGGVVGLAVARALALAGREVVVLEAEGAIGTGTSSRNSEVIHAGIYYPQGSLKARLCVEGKAALYAYAAERGVPHQRCGKLIVATSAEQVAQLEVIRAKAAANGVDDLVLLTAQQAMAMEPQLHCVAALHSPSTGIVDSHALMLSLLGDLENAGGMLALKSPIARAECGQGAIVLVAQDGTALRCNTVVNATGLLAPDLARRFEGLPEAAVPTAYFAKGSYFTLSGRAPFTRLVYPVPEPGGLGVHLTIDLGGQAKFGPDVQWVESADDLVVDPARGNGFYAEVRKYWPALPDGALIPGYAGMRPKISGPDEPARDFMIDGPQSHGVRGLVNLFGIESPGLTSSLAIGRHVERMLASG